MDIQTNIHRHNDGVGGLTFERVQDCTNIAEACKTQQLQGVTGTADMKLAARLPMIMVERYLNGHGLTMNEFITNKEHVKRICNDPAMAHFRVWQGRL